MTMTEYKITVSFRQAKNRERQVSVLAQLNACRVSDIVEILLRNGVAPEDLPARYRKNGGQASKRGYCKIHQQPLPKRDPKTGKMVCAICGTLFEGRCNKVYCPDCGKKRTEELERERRQREQEKRAARIAAAEPKRCAECGAVLENQKAVYCKACAAARAKASRKRSAQRRKEYL